MSSWLNFLIQLNVEDKIILYVPVGNTIIVMNAIDPTQTQCMNIELLDCVSPYDCLVQLDCSQLLLLHNQYLVSDREVPIVI